MRSQKILAAAKGVHAAAVLELISLRVPISADQTFSAAMTLCIGKLEEFDYAACSIKSIKYLKMIYTPWSRDLILPFDSSRFTLTVAA